MMAVNAADLWVRELVTFGAPTIEEREPPADPQAWRAVRQLQAHATDAAGPADALLQLLRGRGLQIGRGWAWSWRSCRPRHLRTLRVGLPGAQLLDCSNLLRYIRAVKTD